MSNDPASRPPPSVPRCCSRRHRTDPRRRRLPHRLQPGWLKAAREHLEVGRGWLWIRKPKSAPAICGWDGAMGDDELDDRP